MENEVKEVTTTSYGGNVKNAFGGLIFGIILFLASFVLLWWNEANSVRLMKQENFIQKNAFFTNSASIDRNNDSKLIATNGSVYTDEMLSDSMISIDKALNLYRNVEMYQWVESEHTETHENSDGSTTKTTTYSYTKEWDDTTHNSNEFKETGYNNPPFPFKSQELSANEAIMGDFKLNKDQIARINAYKNIEKLEPIQGFEIIDKYYYKGNDYSQPQVGDIRISYKYVPSGADVSIIGQQNSDNTISQMPTENGQIYLQYDGVFSLKEMLNKFKQSNTFLTFGLRFAGFLMMFIGLQLLTKPIIAISRFIPFLSNIVEFISTFVVGAVSLVLSLLTIAIAWLIYRPLFAITLLCLIGIIIYSIKQRMQKKINSELA